MPQQNDVTVGMALLYLSSVQYAYENFISLNSTTITGTRINEFSTCESELRVLHRGIIQLLNAINVRPDQLSQYGLRINEESWANPPQTPEAGFEELRIILQHVGSMVHNDNTNIIIPGFDGTLDIRIVDPLVEHVSVEVPMEIDASHEFNVMVEIAQDSDASDNDNGWEEPDPMADAQSATNEQINELARQIIGKEDEGEVCNICFDDIVEGAEIKCLPCSHRFHSQCIDTWLRSSASCPIDRSNVF